MAQQTLEARLRDEIRRRGPIPFADFMRAVLYDPDGGYYSGDGDRIGPAGDFYTAPATHPAFGALLALQLERCWELLGRPGSFTIVEEGGGKGRLAEDISSYVRHLTPEFGQAVDYRIAELGRRGRVIWSADDTEINIDWNDDATPTEIENGVIISNELYDAWARHRVIQQGSTLYELLVDATDGGFIEIIAEPSTPALADRLRQLDVTLPNGSKAEIDLDGPAHLQESAATLRHGFIFTIDYGYPAATLYDGSRREGTLLCYHHHTSSTNPYIRLGKQDITAHVDFTSLARAGEDAGLLTEGLLTQQRYLKKLGSQAFIDVCVSLTSRRRTSLQTAWRCWNSRGQTGSAALASSFTARARRAAGRGAWMKSSSAARAAGLATYRPSCSRRSTCRCWQAAIRSTLNWTPSGPKRNDGTQEKSPQEVTGNDHRRPAQGTWNHSPTARYAGWQLHARQPRPQHSLCGRTTAHAGWPAHCEGKGWRGSDG